MKLGYTLLYVQDVPATVAFYESAFQLKRKFIHESNGYAEMDTGGTTLGFVSLELAGSHGFEFQAVRGENPPPGFELGLVATDVPLAFEQAIKAGAQSVSAPTKKPWGQVVSYVRDCNGFLVEICSAVG